LWHRRQSRRDGHYKLAQISISKGLGIGPASMPIDGKEEFLSLARRHFSSRSRSAFPQNGAGNPMAGLRRQHGWGAWRRETAAKATSQAEPVS
jgi:hypothetical protein